MFLKKSVEDAKERIQILRLRIIDVKNLEEKTIGEISIFNVMYMYLLHSII